MSKDPWNGRGPSPNRMYVANQTIHKADGTTIAKGDLVDGWNTDVIVYEAFFTPLPYRDPLEAPPISRLSPSRDEVLSEQARRIEANLPHGQKALATALHTSQATIRRRLKEE